MGETTLTEYKNDHGVRAIAVNREAEDTLKATNENTLVTYSDDDATSVRGYMFWHNTALQSASFASAASVGDQGFNGCSGLVNLNLPNVTALGSSPFGNCSSLTELDLPELTTMSGAFGACEKVSRVNVPKLLATKNWCFQGFKALVDVELPSATDIGDNTFRDNKALETVILGAATIIRGTAMYNCPKLTGVVIRTNDICTLQNTGCFNSSPFASGGSGGTLWVKRALIEEYKSATNWSVILSYPNNQILAIEDMNNT